jgi:four helix bundle protein
MFQSFEDLEVWKRSCQLAVAVYEILGDRREFTLWNQMQRAAISVPSNIAEGAERGGKDFRRFLRTARGSAAELRTQVYIARKIVMLPDEPFVHLISELRQISKMLTGLSRSLARHRDPKN